MRSKYLLITLLSAFILVTALLTVELGLGDDVIYITEEGVIGSSDIVLDGGVYRFTSDIFSQIVVERDNIILDGGWDLGYTLQPTSAKNGIVVYQRHNVIVRNMMVIGAKNGVKLDDSSECIIEGNLFQDSRLTGVKVQDCLQWNIVRNNNVTGADDEGILLKDTTEAVIYGNYIQGVDGDGIDFEEANGNFIHGNTVHNITYQALDLDHSHGNIIYENNCSRSFNNIYLFRSSGNHIFHNNFYESRGATVFTELSQNLWNTAYPSGGNYWYEYTGIDQKVGVQQDQETSFGDGIGDNPFFVSHVDDDTNVDWLPLMKAYKPIISCMVDPSTVQRGDSITVSGELSPNPGITEVSVVFSKPDGSIIERSTHTDKMGDFSIPFTPIDGGSWSLEASWVGLSGYGGVTSESSSFQVTLPIIVPEPDEPVTTQPPEIQTHITISEPVKGTVYKGSDQIRLIGHITPPLAGVTLLYNYTYPTSHDEEITLFNTRIDTDSSGKFEKILHDYDSGILAGSCRVSVRFREDLPYLSSFNSVGFKIRGKQGCIIVTAAFGSRMHSDVLQMRSFRDSKVSSTFTGDNFVHIFHTWYYSWSPPVAELISSNNALRGVMRIILTPLVYSMRASETVYDVLHFMPELASGTSILTAAALCGVFYLAPLFIVVNHLGFILNFERIYQLQAGAVCIILALAGLVLRSVVLNMFGFGALTVLVSLSCGYCVCNILKMRALN